MSREGTGIGKGKWPMEMAAGKVQPWPGPLGVVRVITSQRCYLPQTFAPSMSARLQAALGGKQPTDEASANRGQIPGEGGG